MADQEINHRFDTNPSLPKVEIVVLGHRNGDIIPILATTVSRAQWQEKPQVSAWTKYYSAYTLIRRHDPQLTQVATSPSRSSTAVASRSVSVQFEQQLDSGQLSGRTVQSYVDFVD